MGYGEKLLQQQLKARQQGSPIKRLVFVDDNRILQRSMDVHLARLRVDIPNQFHAGQMGIALLRPDQSSHLKHGLSDREFHTRFSNQNLLDDLRLIHARQFLAQTRPFEEQFVVVHAELV